MHRSPLFYVVMQHSRAHAETVKIPHLQKHERHLDLVAFHLAQCEQVKAFHYSVCETGVLPGEWVDQPCVFSSGSACLTWGTQSEPLATWEK